MTLTTGASSVALDEAESELGVAWPPSLRELLAASDGLQGAHGVGVVWSVGRIVRDNRAFRDSADFRELYMPFEHLLFFGDAGDGDQFAFPILAGAIRSEDVFVWRHETDSRAWLAPSLERYLRVALVGASAG
ncbi:MAG: SMI1/KNR4 family protein [Acidobacteriota bacterium]